MLPHTGGRLWWSLAAAIAALIATGPVIALCWIAFTPDENLWPHLIATVLPRYVLNTLTLMLGVGIMTLIIGAGCAWLVTMCAFPGRRLFEWALLLPFAAPAYLVAYVYTDLLEYAGPVQGLLRDIFGWRLKSDYTFPEIRSHGGAIWVLSLTLYPYVYLLARAAFMQQSVNLLEAGRTLGCGVWGCFLRLALPMARPALAIGLALVLMETLNDFGTIDYFGVHTLTAGLFDIWLYMDNIAAAAQIALVMLGFVLALLWVERRSRRRQGYFQGATRSRPLPRIPLRGGKGVLACMACTGPLLFGFVVPGLTLGVHALDTVGRGATPEFLTYMGNSLMLSGTAAAGTLAVGLLLAYGLRLGGTPGLRLMTRLATTGYAVPGAVLALGLIIPLAALDNGISAFMDRSFGIHTGLLLTGTGFAVVLAYGIRFLAIGFGAVESGLGSVTPHMDDAARTLGAGHWRILRRIHAPVIRGSILTGAVLVFVDCMKELPATLLLRPFNFETLATHVYQYASDERLAEASLGGLSIIAAGVLPVILLSRAIRATRPDHHAGEGGPPAKNILIGLPE